MIYDNLERMHLYAGAIPLLDELIGELESRDLGTLECGIYYTKENKIRYTLQEYTTAWSKEPEVHGRYMDVQIMVAGNEYLSAFRCNDDLPDSFDKDNDIGFVTADDGISIPMHSGTFAIIFPYEPHTPGLVMNKPESVRKIVAKIPYPA